MSAMAGMGRNGDTMLAHINPEEAAVLKQMGGTGTINPATGLPEYGFLSDLWSGVKKVVKKVAPFVLPAVAIFAPTLIPAIGSALGASAALAPVVGTAVIAGGVTALSGGSAKDVLKSATLSGLGAYLTPVLGKYVSSAVGVTSPVLTNVIGAATFAGGLTALRGGTVGNILKDAATGAAASYIGQVASAAINGTSTGAKVTNAKATQQAFDDAVFAAADAESLAKQGLEEWEIKQALKMTGLSDTVAQSAAAAAKSGASAADITVKITNSAGSAKNLYSDKLTGVQNSIIGGGNVEALEALQRIEDANFIAEDVAQLKAQKLSPAQIKDNLIMAGVDPKVAAAASGWSNRSVDAIVKDLTGSSSFKGKSFFTPEFDAGTVQRDLGTAPGPKATTPTTTPPAAEVTPVPDQTPVQTTPITTPPAGEVAMPVQPGGGTQYFDDGSSLTTDPSGNVTGATNSDGTPYVPGSNPNLPVNQPSLGQTDANGNTRQVFDDGSTLTTDPNGNVVGATNSDGTPYTPGSNPNLPQNQTPTDANGNRKIMFDDGSYQIVDKDGNIIGTVDSDGNPYTPGSNPNLPANQTNPLNPANPVTPPPYVPAEPKPVDPYAGSYVGDYSFGTVTPPDTTQGINPGMMPGSRDYFGTSPVQAQFDWGKTAYQPGPQYNPALNPQLPATPWGLQQMYTPMSPEQLLQLTQGANLYAGLLPTAPGRQG
jgi:SOS response regulatory protein OraA/RecX